MKARAIANRSRLSLPRSRQKADAADLLIHILSFPTALLSLPRQTLLRAAPSFKSAFLVRKKRHTPKNLVLFEKWGFWLPQDDR